MRNPFRRCRPATRTVTVDISLDASRYEEILESLAAARTSRSRTGEVVRVIAYRQRLADERLIGLGYVGKQLDGLCEHFGMDPYVVWRAPRQAERQWRRDRAAWTLHAQQVRRPVAVVRLVGGVL